MPGTLKLNSGGAGNLILTPSGSVGSDVTVTVPAVTGTAMVSANMPAFSAYANTNQTVSNATATKVVFGTEEFDTANCFSSSRFTPNVAGYYQINSAINCSHTSMNDFVTWIYKNGGQYKRGFGFAGSGPSKFIAQACGLVYLNGSSDYVEIYVYSSGSGSATVNASSQDTWFDGTLVRAA